MIHEVYQVKSDVGLLPDTTLIMHTKNIMVIKHEQVVTHIAEHPSPKHRNYPVTGEDL